MAQGPFRGIQGSSGPSHAGRFLLDLKTEVIILKRMYVCVCKAVTEHEIRASIEAGAGTVDAVTRACRAGDDCGACHEAIEELIAERTCGGREAPPVAIRRVRERAA